MLKPSRSTSTIAITRPSGDIVGGTPSRQIPIKPITTRSETNPTRSNSGDQRLVTNLP